MFSPEEVQAADVSVIGDVCPLLATEVSPLFGPLHTCDGQWKWDHDDPRLPVIHLRGAITPPTIIQGATVFCWLCVNVLGVLRHVSRCGWHFYIFHLQAAPLHCGGTLCAQRTMCNPDMILEDIRWWCVKVTVVTHQAKWEVLDDSGLRQILKDQDSILVNFSSISDNRWNVMAKGVNVDLIYEFSNYLLHLWLDQKLPLQWHI